MIINHDHSYVNALDNEFVARGYAEDDLFSIRLTYEYTQEQKEENRRIAESSSREKWNELCKAAAAMRSNYMRPVIEKLADAFVLYQFSDCGVPYDSDKWDLFFWCNDFNTTCRTSDLTGRDYSYMTLNFNKKCSAAQHVELCNKVLELLKENFSGLENLCVSIQYDTRCFTDKIHEDAQKVADGMVGRKYNWNGYDGRLVKYNGQIYWMKKYAKNRGYLMSDAEILRMSWENQ